MCNKEVNNKRLNKLRNNLIIALGFAALILFLSAGLAKADTLIASKSFYAGDSFVNNNIAFQINFAVGLDKIVIVSEGSIVNVANNTCTTLNATKFCLKDITFDATKRDYKASIDIYSVNAELKMTRSISKADLLINEEASIGVTIVNDGGCSATDILFSDEIPSEFEIIFLNGTQNKSNTIYWTGFINNASSISFSYKIRANEETEKSLKANLSYFDCANRRSTFSTPITVKISPALEVKDILGKSQLEIGETNNITINLTNHDSHIITIDSIDVMPDNSVLVVSSNLLNGTEKYYNRNLALNPNSTRSFQMFFKNKFAGSSDIAIDVKYTDYYNRSRGIHKRESIKSTFKPINIKTSFTAGELIESDCTKKIQVAVENPSRFIALKNIRVDVETNITPMNDTFIETLPASSQQVASETKYKAPLVNATQTYPFNIKVLYDTEFGERYEKTLGTSFGIKPPEKLEISHTFTSSVEENSESYIQVSIKNNRNIDLSSLTLYETVPKEFTYAGKIEREIYLRAGSTRSYLYKIKTPYIVNSTVFEINTTAEYTYGNYSYSLTKSSTITVVPKTLSISFEKTIPDSNIYEGKILTVNYKITNNDNEPIRTIKIYPSIQKEFDEVNPKDFISAEDLLPGEYQLITAQESVRPKSNGSIVLKESRMLFEDDDGNSYEKNSSGITLRVLENPIAGPAIMIDKNVNIINSTSGFVTNISLSVKNIGSMETMVELDDSGRTWSVSLEAGVEKKISYQKNLTALTEKEKTTAKVYFPEAVAYYSYSEKKLKTVSNDYSADLPITKEEAAEEETAVETPTPETKEENETGIKEKEKVENESVGVMEGRKGENILDKIIAWIIKFFMMKRSR